MGKFSDRFYEYYLNLSYTCIGDMGAYNDAMENFILAVRYNSNHDKAYHNLRVLYYRKGMDEQAKICFQMSELIKKIK